MSEFGEITTARGEALFELLKVIALEIRSNGEKITFSKEEWEAIVAGMQDLENYAGQTASLNTGDSTKWKNVFTAVSSLIKRDAVIVEE